MYRRRLSTAFRRGDPSSPSKCSLPLYATSGFSPLRRGSNSTPTKARSASTGNLVLNRLLLLAWEGAADATSLPVSGAASEELVLMSSQDQSFAEAVSESRRLRACRLCHSVSSIQYQSYTPGYTTASLSHTHEINRAPTKNNDSVTPQRRPFDYNCRLS
jgi:hypothetical protein